MRGAPLKRLGPGRKRAMEGHENSKAQVVGFGLALWPRREALLRTTSFADKRARRPRAQLFCSASENGAEVRSEVRLEMLLHTHA